ncbi:MAG TPA: hypothetical protein PLW22_11100 [Tenuifilum sp.]|uniref:hypothetical protein n=1 Tax=Tenuifilum sp. TaxID=2760880 RepID=UPI002D05CAA6|nr:hypothetical protein [Tenuifilum sp.]HQG20284.1 hypothetical protein [Tenuifilaceae bacterium]HQI60015.1 hypothetical protein [Tenuifilaceae bacterium]
MDIQTRKIHYTQEFLRVADDELVTKPEKELSPMTMKEFNAIIDKSEDDFENERVTEAQKLLNQIDTWE